MYLSRNSVTTQVQCKNVHVLIVTRELGNAVIQIWFYKNKSIRKSSNSIRKSSNSIHKLRRI